MTALELKHARDSVASDDFELILGFRPPAGRLETPEGIIHLTLRSVKFYLLNLADEVERLQRRVEELERDK